MSEDPGVLLAELSFNDFLSGLDPREKPATGCLFQLLRELAMSPEYMENIARALACFAREASLHTKQGRLEFPRRIRMFCQKKRIDEINSAKPSRPSHTGQSEELMDVLVSECRKTQSKEDGSDFLDSGNTQTDVSPSAQS